MLTDRNPAIWDGEGYVREWAIARDWDRHPICRVPVLSVSPRKMVAVIRFDQPGAPVSYEEAAPGPQVKDADNSGR